MKKQNKKLKETMKLIEERSKCIHKKENYCKKINHYIEGGHAIINHCMSCPFFKLKETGGFKDE